MNSFVNGVSPSASFPFEQIPERCLQLTFSFLSPEEDGDVLIQVNRAFSEFVTKERKAGWLPKVERMFDAFQISKEQAGSYLEEIEGIFATVRPSQQSSDLVAAQVLKLLCSLGGEKIDELCQNGRLDRTAFYPWALGESTATIVDTYESLAPDERGEKLSDFALALLKENRIAEAEVVIQRIPDKTRRDAAGVYWLMRQGRMDEAGDCAERIRGTGMIGERTVKTVALKWVLLGQPLKAKRLTSFLTVPAFKNRLDSALALWQRNPVQAIECAQNISLKEEKLEALLTIAGTFPSCENVIRFFKSETKLLEDLFTLVKFKPIHRLGFRKLAAAQSLLQMAQNFQYPPFLSLAMKIATTLSEGPEKDRLQRAIVLEAYAIPENVMELDLNSLIEGVLKGKKAVYNNRGTSPQWLEAREIGSSQSRLGNKRDFEQISCLFFSEGHSSKESEEDSPLE